MVSGNSLRQPVHTHHASVHQAAKLVAALLGVVGVTASLAESNGSLPPRVCLTSPAGWLPRTGISSGTLCSVINYGLTLPFFFTVEFSCISKIVQWHFFWLAHKLIDRCLLPKFPRNLHIKSYKSGSILTKIIQNTRRDTMQTVKWLTQKTNGNIY